MLRLLHILGVELTLGTSPGVARMPQVIAVVGAQVPQGIAMQVAEAIFQGPQQAADRLSG